jgi:hypothetical protein
MATHDVLADVGATLVSIIGAGVSSIVVPSNVTLKTTDEMRQFSPPGPAVTIFLYHIGTSAEMRNAPPPLGFSRPRLPLDLRYLVTPWATDAGTAHQICGHVLRTLYDHASLVAGDLKGTSWSPDDTLQILLESIPVSEHHHIWEPADIPYKLSLSYLVRVVGLDSSVPAGTGVVATATTGGLP